MAKPLSPYKRLESPTPSTVSVKSMNALYYEERGLGYGIDVTNDTPWETKGPLIACKIESPSDIKKIVHSGAFYHYHREIVSGKDISLNLSATLTAFNDVVKMGVDTDISRSSSFSQHAIGNKIHTQTIDFVVDTSSTLTAFEEMLRQNIDFDAIKDEPEQLQRKCRVFVGKYRCTHYVRAIHLGAVEYEVMSSDIYSRVYSTRGELGVAGLHHASASAKAGVQRKKGKKTYDRKYTKIGKWNDEFEIVEEKVIEIEITPIQMLIKTPQLQIALAYAVKEYRKERLQERRKFYVVINYNKLL